MVRGRTVHTGRGQHGGPVGASLSVPLGLVWLHRGVVASPGQLVHGLFPVGEMHCPVIYIRDSGEFPVRHQQSSLGIPECEPLSPLPPRGQKRVHLGGALDPVTGALFDPAGDLAGVSGGVDEHRIPVHEDCEGLESAGNQGAVDGAVCPPVLVGVDDSVEVNGDGFGDHRYLIGGQRGSGTGTGTYRILGSWWMMLTVFGIGSTLKPAVSRRSRNSSAVSASSAAAIAASLVIGCPPGRGCRRILHIRRTRRCGGARRRRGRRCRGG